MTRLLYALIVILFCNTKLYAQQERIYNYPRDENGNFTFEYIHNIYNRTEDVVYKIAKEFLLAMPELTDTLVNDPVAKTVHGRYKWRYDGLKKDCVKAADVMVTITIFYKDNRTKITFTNFSYTNAQTTCQPQGKVDDLDKCPACARVNGMLPSLKGNCYSIGNIDYKRFLERKARDRKLF